jgi:DNA-binding NtrC family response regulator
MKKRAFILDDQRLMSELLKQILEDRGYEVLSFSDPRDCPLFNKGICHCTDGQICGDIIISDINMPNNHGLDLIERQKKSGCKIKNIALMSGFWTGSDLRKAEKLGCKVFHKPFTIDEIEEWLDDCAKRIDPNRDLTDWFSEMGDQAQAKAAN